MQEPRLTLALLMLDGLRIGYGDFISKLAFDLRLCDNSSRNKILLADFSPHTDKSLPHIFGALLVTARKQNGLTQVLLSEYICYHLRNITKIENGTQEPRIMTAIKLVSATGCDIKDFFDKLQTLAHH